MESKKWKVESKWYMSPKIIAVLIVVHLLPACGKKEVTEITEKKVSTSRVMIPVFEKKVEIKYRYQGGNYRDPFLSLTEKGMISPSLASKGEGEMPNFGSLSLKGIMRDSSTKIALLSSPMGRYVLRNDKLYDSRNRVVKGIKGTIGERRVKLVTRDNFACELKFREIR